MKKILYVITDAGSGHKMAASSMTAAVEELFPNKFEQRTVDLFKVLDVDPFNSSDASYAFMSSNRAFEAFNNFIFRFFNTSIGYDIFRKYVETRLYKEAIEFFEAEKPDLVVCIHPIVGVLIRLVKEKNPEIFKSMQVILDPVTIFRGWADNTADLIISPSNEAVNTLVNYGVDVSKIVYPLFPINPKVKNFRIKEEVTRELGFSNEKPIILMTGGGVGTGPLKKALEMLIENDKYQIILLAGKLDYLREQLQAKYSSNKNIQIFGYIDNIQDYYNACDVVIAKPSSATIMEVDLFKKKGIWTRYIGEQDAGNPTYVQRNPRFRYIGYEWDQLIPNLEDLLNSELRDPVQGPERSFDESQKIAKEINKLL